MNRIVTIKRHWLATLLAAVCILLGTQTAWAQAPVTYSVTRTARSNTEFTFTQPSNNVETTVEYVDAGASIRPTGNTDATNDLYYLTLADALADAADGDVIKLLADETITTGLTINNSITLDLNGHTLTCTGTNEVALTVSSGKTVTIQDGGTGGGITGTKVGIDNNGTLTVTGGTITGTSNNGYGIYNEGTLTVSGGTITCSGTNGRGIFNNVDATLTISGTPTISANVTGGIGIVNIGTAFNLSGNPSLSGTVADIYLNTDKIITINAALTAPATAGEIPVADPWTVESNNIDTDATTPYIFTTGFSTYCLNGSNVADPAAYFSYFDNTVGIRLVDGTTEGSKEAQFVTYTALSDETATKPTVTAAPHSGAYWIGDELTAATTATPADGITWQWYRQLGDADPIAIDGATGSGVSTTYTLTAADFEYQVFAVATMAAGAAGTGYPASDVTVASTATAAVEKKDNFGTLTAIAEPTMASIGATIADAKAGVEYLVVADGVVPTDALWALATAPTADGSLTLNQFVVSSDPASLSNMQPTTAYDLYYRLVETDDTKAGNSNDTYGKPVNELKTDITTLAWNYQITTGGVTYELSHPYSSGTPTTAKVVAIPTEGTSAPKTATILAAIPADNTQLLAGLDVWKELGYVADDATAFADDIVVDATQTDYTSINLSVIGSGAGTYGIIQADDETVYTVLANNEASSTTEGYAIFNYGGGYYALSNASGVYAAATKNKTVAESGMTDILSAAGMSGGAIAFKDLAGTALPAGTGDDADKLMAAAGQTVVIEVTLPTGFEFASDACKILNVTYGTSPVTSVEISLADTDADGTWTAEFTMPSEAVTVSFKEDEPIQGKTVTFDVPESAMLTGGTMMADAGNPSPIHVGENVSFIITPNTTTAAVGDGGYALTDLTLSDGTTTYTPTYTIVDAEVTTPVTLPTEKAVKVTFKVPATAADEFTFTPTFTKTFERIAFDVGRKTYYESKGMKLRSENADLKFYTVTGVSGSTVTVTEITSKTIPANMPFIVENSSGETAFDVYIAETGDANTAYATACAVTAATQFKGSTTATTLPFTSGISYYGFNGTDFILLTNDGTAIPANRCWLEMSGGAATRATVDWGDGTTAIRSLNADEEDGDWYDINGRKLQRKPTKKGVYILNGQKKVVK